jgi:hypothetical protein
MKIKKCGSQGEEDYESINRYAITSICNGYDGCALQSL